MQPSPFHADLAAAGAHAEAQGVRHFGNPAAEAHALRHGAGILDVSDHGVLRLRGNDRLSLLQRITSADVAHLAPGTVAMNHFVTAKGRILDRVRLVVDQDHVDVITTPGHTANVRTNLEKYTIIEDATVEDRSPRSALLHVLGPRARALLQDVLGTAAPAPGRFVHARVAHADGAADVVAIATEGLRDTPGVLLLLDVPPESPSGAPAALLHALLATARAHDARLIGEDAYDALRIERGLPLFGREVTDEENPLESGFHDAVAFDKGCYVGQEVLARLRNYDKIMRHLCRLECATPLAAGTPLFHEDKQVGEVRSAAAPPLVDKPRALGFVKRRVVQAGATLRAGSPDGPEVAIVDVVRL